MNYYILILYILGFCISPAFALGDDNRNFMLIGLMGVAPLFLFYKTQWFPKVDIACFIVCLSLTLFPLLSHPETMRWSTVCYSYMFFLSFIVIVRLLTWSKFSLLRYINLLKWLIYAYTLVLVVQQICVILGLPIFNVSNYDIFEPWKLNSLSSEPSHTARFMTILMYSFLWMRKLQDGNKQLSFKYSYKKDKYVWIAYLWTMLTMMSGTAMLMLCIIFLPYLSKKHIINLSLVIVSLFVVICYVDFKPMHRFLSFSEAVLSFDKDKMYLADSSASFRVIPFVVCAEQIELNSVDGWCGKGIDYGANNLYKSLISVEKGYTAGGYALVALEYGFIVFVLITIFTFSICYNNQNRVISVLLWLFCCFSLGVNTQIGWSLIILSYINKYFYNHNKISFSNI